ncbi:MAG: hypothetical protein K6G07_01585 [Lachnospiraceae bacterium]|nr:hypothetical protein [Lachnospiraceae bacterium]
MDIKEQVSGIVKKISSDKSLQEKFKKDPEKTIEELAGVDIPDGMLDKVTEAVKGKLTLDKAGDAVESLKKLF